MNWYLEALKKYAVFSGRARRSEYWFFLLFNIIASIIFGVIDGVLKVNILAPLYSLAVLIPALAVSVRRLHDTGRSGFWIFINFVPFIGWIWFIILTVLDSQPGSNEYGPNPKATPPPIP